MRATRRRDVTGTGISDRTGTISVASCGRTSLNQPTAPAISRTAPSALTDALVTSPAKSSVVPNASTNGQVVAAGTSSALGTSGRAFVRVSMSVRMPIASAPDHVDHGEDDDPHRVDEVPVHGEHFESRRVLAAHVSAHCQQEHERET